jgi:hypothetical protein
MSGQVLYACLVAGIVFAALAVWLTTQRGNTIQEILKETKDSTADALKMEIAGKFKLATNMPIIALYCIAAVVSIGPLVYWIYVTSLNVECDSTAMRGGAIRATHDCYEVWHISGQITNLEQGKEVSAALSRPRVALVNGSFDDELPIKIDPSGTPWFPSIELTSKDYRPLHLHLQEGADTPCQFISATMDNKKKIAHFSSIVLCK